MAFLYDPERPLALPGASFVIARLEIDFQAELHWPGRVEIGTGVAEIGGRSFHLIQGLFSAGRPVAVDGLGSRLRPRDCLGAAPRRRRTPTRSRTGAAR